MSYAGFLIDQLVQQGVTCICIAPGSRSAPLAIAAQKHPGVKTIVHFDERGLGFYALGWGKARKAPAAIITTSGSAVANLAPACMEAFHSKIPLVLLTADRPHELRFCGANQTTDQMQLFGGVLKWRIDLTGNLSEKAVRSIASQGVFQSLEGTPGPVQINCPFAEPLYGDQPVAIGERMAFAVAKPLAQPIVQNAERGIILLGAMSNPRPALELARQLRWPVFADLLSSARRYPSSEQIRRFDFLLRAANVPEPDLILHMGGAFVSKQVLLWKTDAARVHVSPFAELQDPTRSLHFRIQSDIEYFCKTFINPPADPAWLKTWQDLDSALEKRLEAHFQLPCTEAHHFLSLPADRPIYFGSSMPIRYADHFFFPSNCPPLFANRGVSGIDGNIATIAGIADGLQAPITAVIGDQTALHDLNSLALLRDKEIRLIISNNSGGGIFDHLPSKDSPFLDTTFAAAHTLNFEHAAKMFDLPYVRVEHLQGNLPSQGIIELVTERRQSAAFFQEFAMQCK